MASSSTVQGQMELNPRGIPRAPFVANVEEYVGGPSGPVEPIIKTFQETSAKYRYMEVSLQQRRKALLSKIPDIEETLRVVRFLKARRDPQPNAGADADDDAGSSDSLDDDLDEEEEEEVGKGDEGKPLKTLFELNDTLYAEAEVRETGEVGIWLGANTMLMYPLAEAEELLSTKLQSAKTSLGEVAEDLEWIREQVTVMEVNFARVHNWDVKRRREQKATGVLEDRRKDDDSDDEKD